MLSHLKILNMRNGRDFAIPLAEILNRGVAIKVASLNVSSGDMPDGHVAEACVQRVMVELLAVHLPSADMIKQNEKMLEHSRLGGCIPDVIINNVGSGVWGVFEIKTLLVEDRLGAAEVVYDLEKLCAYKEVYPKAAAVFLLVGSRSKLFNTSRAAAWSDLKISYDYDSFSGGVLKSQVINEEYIAIPCGSYNVEGFPTVCFMWEIQLAKKAPQTLSSFFSYQARMSRAKGGVK